MKVYLHIGLHKTATTYLQKNVFPYGSGELKYNDSELSELLVKCFKLPRLVNETTQEFKAKLETLPESTKLFFSYEIMCGNLFSLYDNSEYTQGLIKDLFSDCDLKVIVVLRNQVDWLISCYRESAHEHHYQKMDSFLSFNDGVFKKPKSYMNENGYACCNPYLLNYSKCTNQPNKFYNQSNHQLCHCIGPIDK